MRREIWFQSALIENVGVGMRYHQVYQVEFKGIRVLMASFQNDFPTDDMVIGDIIRSAYHEEEAVTWWLAMLNCAKAGDIAVDAGSYTGLYSLLASKSRPDIRTVAIEASSITFGRLVHNIVLNGADAVINPNHVALTTKPEVVTLGHAYGVTAMSSGESLAPIYDTDYSELVAGVTIDSFLIQDQGRFGPISSKSSAILPISGIAGMKVDLEGVEIEVLQNGGQVLSRYAPPIVIELLTDEAVSSCDELLAKHGYSRVSDCPGSNFVYVTAEKAGALKASFEATRDFGGSSFNIDLVSSISISV